MNPPDTQTTLREMDVALQAYLRQPCSPDALSAAWRRLAPGLGLPARFQDVMHSLLDSAESAALFDTEACAFSPRELQQNLQDWLEAARVWTQRNGPPGR